MAYFIESSPIGGGPSHGAGNSKFLGYEAAGVPDKAIEKAVIRYLNGYYKKHKRPPPFPETYVLLANDMQPTDPDVGNYLRVTSVGADAAWMEKNGYRSIATVTGGYDDGADRWDLKITREK